MRWFWGNAFATAPHYFNTINYFGRGAFWVVLSSLCFLFLSFHILYRSVFLSSIFLLSSSNRNIIMTSSSSSLYGCWRAKFLFLMSLRPVHSNRKCLKSSFSPWHKSHLVLSLVNLFLEFSGSMLVLVWKSTTDAVVLSYTSSSFTFCFHLLYISRCQPRRYSGSRLEKIHDFIKDSSVIW